ncbi:diacylglycerol kinase [Virgibacillus alimentarius]|uniref:Diacylglycerol kinase (ATP) n=1 Tax=Virgibacillus alimentarius TaxID=698769 RepID=A0ABS4S9W9_9BACI|nr:MULTISPECIES: diacylglycerol kinase [Virgibacillus]MBP2257674.1 diacylglycerol kinase (ATP) [Virgibacillus alimentarius]HLR69768.1 diacylglycerol kinase [Virgibacillus sp.]
MKKARIIYNPTSGREIFKKDLANVLERFEVAGYVTSTHATTSEGDAIEAAKWAAECRYDLVVAAGGDGTINEVINGIAGQDVRPKLGIIPVGTTNDFARALLIPRDIKKAVDIIVEGQSMPLDIGKVNEHYFMNIAGGGKLTELTYEVPSKLKTMLGQLAYYIKGIEMLPSLKPTEVRIEYDDNIINEDIMLFLVSNTNSVGGFEKLAPDAKFDDGYFDLIILRKTNLAEFIRIATLALRGAHLDDKSVIYAQAKRVRVTPKDKMQLNIDGEFGGMLPGEFKNLRQHIEFCVPDIFINKEDS